VTDGPGAELPADSHRRTVGRRTPGENPDDEAGRTTRLSTAC